MQGIQSSEKRCAADTLINAVNLPNRSTDGVDAMATGLLD